MSLVQKKPRGDLTLRVRQEADMSRTNPHGDPAVASSSSSSSDHVAQQIPPHGASPIRFSRHPRLELLEQVGTASAYGKSPGSNSASNLIAHATPTHITPTCDPLIMRQVRLARGKREARASTVHVTRSDLTLVPASATGGQVRVASHDTCRENMRSGKNDVQITRDSARVTAIQVPLHPRHE